MIRLCSVGTWMREFNACMCAHVNVCTFLDGSIASGFGFELHVLLVMTSQENRTTFSSKMSKSNALLWINDDQLFYFLFLFVFYFH